MRFWIGRLAFEWDAATIFMDGSAKTYYDLEHSDEEDRYYSIGFARSGRLLTVWYTQRAERLRLIGARRATPRERSRYNADAKKEH